MKHEKGDKLPPTAKPRDGVTTQDSGSNSPPPDKKPPVVEP